MSAPTRSYPALGFDPAPGTADTVGSLAADLGSVAAELDAAHQALTSIGRSSGIWQGEAAQAFGEKLGELPDYLDKANHSLGDATSTLRQWSSDLASMQTTAAQYEVEAEQALRQLQAAQASPDLGLAGQAFPDAASLQQAQARYEAAQSAVQAASGELDQIRDVARRLLAQHESLVADVAGALRKAKDEAPDEPGLLDRIGDAFGKLVDGVKDAAGKVWQWVKDHADTIKQFGDIMGQVSTALGVIAIVTAPFEPVGAVFAAAAAGTSVVALGAHGLAKAAGADVGWGSLAGDALGALPFAGGLARGAKVVTGAERALGATRGEVLDYASSRAEQIGGRVVGRHAAGSKFTIKGDGAVGRVATGAESAYQSVREGQLLGTKGLNPIIRKLGGEGIDPLSVGGRALDASIKGGKAVGTEVYHQLSGSDGS